jgi:hypothetical protein
MDSQSLHTINFVYDVHDHALKFPLKAEVEQISPGVFEISNIRPDSQDHGALLPPIQLTRKDNKWIFVGNGQESNLSLTIGQAIDRQIQYL